MKILADSSADLLSLAGADFASVPLKLVTGEREYVDDAALDTHEMIEALSRYKGRSGSSCPNVKEYLDAFGDADEIFCLTITSRLSGSFGAAEIAAREYSTLHAERRVCVLDTRSAGAEIALLAEKIAEMARDGLSFEQIERGIREYAKHTHLIFALRSLHNLAANGRVSSLTARLAGILGIRIVGRASEDGVLEITNKSRGEARMLSDILANMRQNGYCGGRVRIHHAENEAAALALREQLLAAYPTASVEIGETRGLCSFYAERGGLMVGYEG